MLKSMDFSPLIPTLVSLTGFVFFFASPYFFIMVRYFSHTFFFVCLYHFLELFQQKALEAAMNDINSSFGKGSVTRLGSAGGALVYVFF